MICIVWTACSYSWEKLKVMFTYLGWLRGETDWDGLLGELGQHCISPFIALSTCVHYVMMPLNHLLYPDSGLSNIGLQKGLFSAMPASQRFPSGSLTHCPHRGLWAPYLNVLFPLWFYKMNVEKEGVGTSGGSRVLLNVVWKQSIHLGL